MSSKRVVLVTGGAVRLGRATVELLARSGWRVAFTYRSSAAEAGELEANLRKEGRDVHAFQADLDDPPARRALSAAVVERLGGLDALVNNAAVFPRTPLAALDEARFAAVLRTNLEAPLFLALAAREALAARSGAVVNIADIYGFFPLREHLAYSVAKAALVAATKALAVELAPAVRVNAVAPGIALFPTDYDEDTKRRLVARTLLKREGNAEEIARAVQYLLEGTLTMTGQVLVLDGGRTIAL